MEWVVRLNPNFSMGQGYYGLALSYVGRWQEGFRRGEPGAAPQPARSAGRHLLRRRRLRAVHRPQLRRGDAVARQGVRQRPDFVGAHRVLTAAAAMAGQTEAAAAALKELRRAQPNISLAWIEKEMPIRDIAERAHYVEAFRRAGME